MLFQSGYVWNVTFATAVGDVPQMIPTDELTGIGHHISVVTAVQGNTIQGSFKVGFLGRVTRDIPVTATEQLMEEILQVPWHRYYVAILLIRRCGHDLPIIVEREREREREREGEREIRE